MMRLQSMHNIKIQVEGTKSFNNNRHHHRYERTRQTERHHNLTSTP